MLPQEQIKALNTRKDELYKFINIKAKKTEADKLGALSQKNDFWNNPKEAQILLKQLSTLQSWIKSYNNVSNNIDELSLRGRLCIGGGVGTWVIGDTWYVVVSYRSKP